MKKTKLLISLLLCLAMLASLTGCGKSAEAKAAEDLINAIGEVTVKSEGAIERAEAAYAALSEADQKAVSNYAKLTAAREALDAAQLAEVQEAILGTWLYEGDLSEYYESQINDLLNEGVPDFVLDSFPVHVNYTFRDDGTYEVSLDKDVLKESMNKIVESMKAWLDEYLLKAVGEGLAAQGITVDYSSWEALEKSTEMTREEIYELMLGMKAEDHFIEGLEFAGAHGMSGNGMGPAVTNGRAAAKGVLEAMEKKKEGAAK